MLRQAQEVPPVGHWLYPKRAAEIYVIARLYDLYLAAFATIIFANHYSLLSTINEPFYRCIYSILAMTSSKESVKLIVCHERR